MLYSNADEVSTNSDDISHMTIVNPFEIRFLSIANYQMQGKTRVKRKKKKKKEKEGRREKKIYFSLLFFSRRGIVFRGRSLSRRQVAVRCQNCQRETKRIVGID
jgi:hypothetical protein